MVKMQLIRQAFRKHIFQGICLRVSPKFTSILDEQIARFTLVLFEQPLGNNIKKVSGN